MKLQRFSSFFKGLALTLCCVLLTVCSQESRSGAEQGMRFCLGVLTPSLFPFMALTNLLVKTGLCQAAGRRFGLPPMLFWSVVVQGCTLRETLTALFRPWNCA